MIIEGKQLASELRVKGVKSRDKVMLKPVSPNAVAEWATDKKLKQMLSGAKQRAKKKGLQFDLKVEDLYPVYDTCPILGVKLVAGTGKVCPSSPTLDKIDPTLGYVKGNVRVISNKANRMKTDATIEELKLFITGIMPYMVAD
jgi:hypothetical protein